MSDGASKIKSLLREVAGTDRQQVLLRRGVVKSVEGAKCTVTVNGLEVADVLLTAFADTADKGVLITPAKDSVVLLADLSLGEMREFMVIGYSAVDNIVIHGGENEGLAVSPKIVERLNAIEEDINKLKTIFSLWVPEGKIDDASGLKKDTETWSASGLKETTLGDIENDKIKQ